MNAAEFNNLKEELGQVKKEKQHMSMLIEMLKSTSEADKAQISALKEQNKELKSLYEEAKKENVVADGTRHGTRHKTKRRKDYKAALKTLREETLDRMSEKRDIVENLRNKVPYARRKWYYH